MHSVFRNLQSSDQPSARSQWQHHLRTAKGLSMGDVNSQSLDVQEAGEEEKETSYGVSITSAEAVEFCRDGKSFEGRDGC